MEGLKESNWVEGMEYSRNSKLKKMCKDDGTDATSTDHFKKSEISRTGGSILGLLEVVVKVGQIMGKDNVTISDSLVMVRGVWRLTGQKCLLIALYAPQDAKEKQMLWDYLQCGSSFTWCHKSTSKMSKLDRFLISENLLYSCPNINVITLDRYLSDHRPILLREAVFDYGPIPFKFFHHWLEMDGFIKVVEDAWREYAGEEPNAMRSMMAQYKSELEAIDSIIERGNEGEEEVNKRAEIINKILKTDKLHSMEIAQKAKVKWIIEGDENSSFFHGMLNKKRNILNIQGVMVDRVWLDNPNRTLSEDRVKEMECDVTNDEIKRAVWDCGTKKSPGPDGFTFGFFRRFWYLIQKDVNAAVRLISLIGSLYKIIAKILANRLVGVLGDIVNEVQSTFIADRQILDGPFILNEVIQCSTEEFQFGKGLKQGDPLSPFLFILTMESLHLSFQRIVDAVHVLECFYMASGLRISMSKSKIMGVNVDCDKVNRAAVRLGCLVLKTPFSYLGSIVGGHMSWKHTWNEIVERVKKRLSKWKMKTLSIGGRMTLVKSPFFDGHETNSKKASWVNWKKDLVSKDRGGLGISSLFAMNRGLMFKWVWRFLTQESTLWARIIKAIHGEDGRIGTTTRGGPKSCWMVIIWEMYDLSKNDIDSLKYLRIKLGNGENTAFWEDKW
nr:hypothetical protein [Tanacetum cinerariifolium]